MINKLKADRTDQTSYEDATDTKSKMGKELYQTYWLSAITNLTMTVSTDLTMITVSHKRMQQVKYYCC